MRVATLVLLLLPGFLNAQTFTDASDTFPSFGPFSLGVTILDVDGDGRTDIVFGNNLLRQIDSGFQLIAIESGGSSLGTLVADFDRDGQREVVLLEGVEARPSRYSVARQSFSPIVGSGIDTPQFPLIQGSIWLDDDRDGNLDLLIGNDGPPDVLLRNNGDGTFIDVSQTVLPGTEGGTYGMAAADYDRDGDPDIAIGLCLPNPSPNLLYRRGQTAFTEVAVTAGTNDPLASWGLAWLDYNGDGWFDLYVANMPQSGRSGTNSLFRNNGNGTFTNMAATAGVDGPSTEQSWSTVAEDFDNDGHTDLVVANSPQSWRLWRNQGNNTFEDASSGSGIDILSDLVIGAGDVNDDGWVDLLSIQGGQATLLLNDGGANGWLSLRLRGVASNPEGLGARVEVEAGSLRMVREITGGDGFMAQSHSLKAHFGLGQEQTADVTVRWPSGQVDVLEDVGRNQHITLVEGVGINEPPEAFTLIGPEDGSAVDQWATLSWEPAIDPEGGTTDYTVHLAGPAGDETFNTTETSLSVPLGSIGEYRWAVTAEDEYTKRTSQDAYSFMNGTVAIEDSSPVDNSLTLRVWPNPTNGLATITYDTSHLQHLNLEVVDVLGRRVWFGELGLRSTESHQITLDLHTLSNGVYLLQLAGEKGILATQQVTLQR